MIKLCKFVFFCFLIGLYSLCFASEGEYFYRQKVDGIEVTFAFDARTKNITVTVDNLNDKHIVFQDFIGVSNSLLVQRSEREYLARSWRGKFIHHGLSIRVLDENDDKPEIILFPTVTISPEARQDSNASVVSDFIIPANTNFTVETNIRNITGIKQQDIVNFFTKKFMFRLEIFYRNNELDINRWNQELGLYVSTLKEPILLETEWIKLPENDSDHAKWLRSYEMLSTEGRLLLDSSKMSKIERTK